MNPSVYEKLDKLKNEGQITEKILALMKSCYDNYRMAAFAGDEHWRKQENLFARYVDEVVKQLEEPYHFEPFHRKVTSPFDYRQFSIDFMKPLIILDESTLSGIDNLETIRRMVASGENVILLANHQTEPDPQIIFIMLENRFSKLAQEMIFIAGDRVVTDPMAVPFSMGCNLICIFSKKHIENPPELKEEKLKHNQRTMKVLSELLSEGGKCIYVAPSGGRDRPDEEGVVDVAPFDPSSIEMLRLMAKQADKPTHFFPLALSTYDILPPPNSVDVEIGEDRKTKRSPAHLSFGNEIDMNDFPGSDAEDKKLLRQNRAEYIWSIVKDLYHSV